MSKLFAYPLQLNHARLAQFLMSLGEFRVVEYRGVESYTELGAITFPTIELSLRGPGDRIDMLALEKFLITAESLGYCVNRHSFSRSTERPRIERAEMSLVQMPVPPGLAALIAADDAEN